MTEADGERKRQCGSRKPGFGGGAEGVTTCNKERAVTDMRTITAVVVALACGMISACGGSSHRSSAAADPLLAVSQCMRAHGVPNFPDPGMGRYGSEGMTEVSGPGSSTETIQGIPFSGPAFQAAEKTCNPDTGGGSPPPQDTESYRLAALHFAHCMRAHGVPNYPDPTFADGGPQTGSGPQINKNAPTVVHAAKTCSKYQPSNGRGF